jgi:flagella basal body P-ring formation protein FlgA
MNKLFWVSLLIGFITLIPMVAQGEGSEIATITFEIPEMATIGGPKIFLNDLGKVSSGPNNVSDYLKQVDLGAVPAPGQVRSFSREYLNSIIRQYKFPVVINLQMGERVVVKSMAACVQGTEVEKVIQNLITEENPHLIKKWVELRNVPEVLWLSQGDWKIIAFPIGNLPEVGNALFKVILTKGKETKTINISGKIKATAQVYRALRNISHQALINQTDFELVAMELANGRELMGEIPNQTRSTKLIKQGEILRSDWVQPIPLVCKDHQVKVIVKDENVVIKIIGIAKFDGWLGDEILIMNPVSNKIFKAKVKGNGVVEVNLQ